MALIWSRVCARACTCLAFVTGFVSTARHLRLSKSTHAHSSALRADATYVCTRRIVTACALHSVRRATRAPSSSRPELSRVCVFDALQAKRGDGRAGGTLFEPGASLIVAEASGQAARGVVSGGRGGAAPSTGERVESCAGRAWPATGDVLDAVAVLSQDERASARRELESWQLVSSKERRRTGADPGRRLHQDVRSRSKPALSVCPLPPSEPCGRTQFTSCERAAHLILVSRAAAECAAEK
eukprot:6209929-Pleurochrysis_carterae.AAC.2